MSLKGKYGTEGLDAVAATILDGINSDMELAAKMFIIREAIRGQLAGYRKKVIKKISEGYVPNDIPQVNAFQEIAIRDISEIYIDGGFENEF